jgi:hypothetical protein
MIPEEKKALMMKMSAIVEGMTSKEADFFAGEFLIWSVLQKPENVKEFLSVNEDFRKQFKIEI